MLNLNEIMQAYETISDSDSNISSKFKHFFIIAKHQIEALLIKNKINEDEKIILTNICAALANCWILMQQNSNSAVNSFSANGFKLNCKPISKIKAAKMLFFSLRLGAVDLLKDDGFSIFASLNSIKGCSKN